MSGYRRLRRAVGEGFLSAVDAVERQPSVAKKRFAQILARADGGRDADERLFLDFASALRHRGHAQLLQDLWVLFETDLRRDGFFVEFGAADGVVHSNTLTLERDFGWRGVLIEPVPDMAARARRNRSATVVQACVWDEPGMELSFLVADDPEYSSIESTAFQDLHSDYRRSSSERIVVHGRSLQDILESENAPRVIDYMSVDTEGSELNALKSLDWGAFGVKLLSVEHNYRPDFSEIESFLAERGFVRRFRTLSDFDAWFVAKST